MSRRKKKFENVMELKRIIEILRNDPIIWLPQEAWDQEQVARFQPVGYSGTGSEYQFVVIRYTDVVGDHYNGNAVHDDTGAMVVLPANLCESIFHFAQHKCSLATDLDSNLGDRGQPGPDQHAAKISGGL